MLVVAFLLPWVLLGIAVVVVAFRSGPTGPRRARGRGLRVVFAPLFLILAVLIPGAVIADNGPSRGGPGALASSTLSEEQERGRELFRQTCASCHSLRAANARGVTGPNLDQLGAIDKRRVENAIRIGGSGEKRMPAGLLDGENASAVAAYVARTAGQ